MVSICPTCNKSFATKTALAAHRRTHGNILPGRVRILPGRARRRVPTRYLPLNARRSKIRQGLSTNYDGSSRAIDPAVEADYGSSSVDYTGTGVVQHRRPALGIQSAVASILADTPEGRAWAMAALHPCGAGEVLAPNIGVMNGMCDTMTGSVATPVYRGENHITFQPGLFNYPTPPPDPKPLTTYGVDIIIPPIPEIDFVYRLIDDANNIKTDWIVVRLGGFELAEPPSYPEGGYGYNDTSKFVTFGGLGYGKVRQIACGHTIELDASALNNQGRIIVGQMEGQWREAIMAVPVSQVTTAQFVTEVDPTVTKSAAVTGVRVAGTEDTVHTWSLYIPTDPVEITQSCPNAYQGLAKHGAYVVSKFSAPLLGYQFKRSGPGDVFYAGDPPYDAHRPYLPQSAFALNTAVDSYDKIGYGDSFYSMTHSDPHWSAFGDKLTWLHAGPPDNFAAFIGQNSFHPGVSAPSDMMVSVAMLRNLPAGGTGTGNTASIRIKSRNYYECISNAINPGVAPFVHPPATYDFRALNSVIIAGKQLADAYPASANSLGDILRRVWGALKTYGPGVIKTARGVADVIEESDIPGVAEGAGVAKDALDAAGNIVRAFENFRF